MTITNVDTGGDVIFANKTPLHIKTLTVEDSNINGTFFEMNNSSLTTTELSTAHNVINSAMFLFRDSNAIINDASLTSTTFRVINNVVGETICLAENSHVSIDYAVMDDSNTGNHLFRSTDAPFTSNIFSFRNNRISNTMLNISTCAAASMTTATVVSNIIVNGFYLINCDFDNNAMNTQVIQLVLICFII